MTNLLEQAIAVVNYYSANMADRSSSSATGCRPMRGICLTSARSLVGFLLRKRLAMIPKQAWNRTRLAACIA
jgi:hypothetical protein